MCLERLAQLVSSLAGGRVSFPPGVITAYIISEQEVMGWGWEWEGLVNLATFRTSKDFQVACTRSLQNFVYFLSLNNPPSRGWSVSIKSKQLQTVTVY